jgi:small-conductance mechanosensitive channel
MDPAIFVSFTFCFTVYIVFTSVRRYLIAKTKANLQEKVLQRIDSSEALASLAANESGRRFLESITIEENKTSSPFGRILFGVQAGLVLIFFGGAMIFAQRYINVSFPGFIIVGTGAIGLGLGFLTASAASVFVSRKLGLIAGESRG